MSSRVAGTVAIVALVIAVLVPASASATPPREGPWNGYLTTSPGNWPLIQVEVFDDIDGQLIPFRKELRFIDIYWPGTDCTFTTGPVPIAPDDSFRYVWPLPDGQMAVIEGRFVTRTTVTGVFWSNLDNRYSSCKLDQPLAWSGHPCCPTNPAPAPGPPIASGRYVALGDSYSSGEGVPPFEGGTDTKKNRCHRSKGAYSRVFAELANETDSKFPGTYSGFDGLGDGFYGAGDPTFLACSGATTENVGRLDPAGQVEGAPQPGEPGTQLEGLAPEQWWFTDLITMTIGGNDAQFAGVLKQCLLFACHRGKRAEKIKERIANEVPPRLAATYASIRRLAPNATVFVLGYPQLFPDELRPRCPIGKRVVSRSKQAFLRERGEQLNAMIAAQAAAAEIHFVGVERAFAGHEPCGKKEEWVHALVLKDPVFSFHPNAQGQKAYARRLGAYFICLAKRGYPFTHFGGIPEIPSPEQPVPPQCA